MRKISLFVLIFFLSACYSKTSHLPLLVPYNSSFDKEDLHKAKVIENVTEEDSKFVFAIFPLGYPNFERTIDKMLKDNKGKAIVNATVVESSRWYGLYGFNELKIKADIVR